MGVAAKCIELVVSESLRDIDKGEEGGVKWLYWERRAFGRFEADTVGVCGIALGTALLCACLLVGGEPIYECRGNCRDDGKQD